MQAHEPSHAVGIGRVCATLVAGKINERELAPQPALRRAENELEDGVGARRVLVCGRGAGCPHGHAGLEQRHDVTLGVDSLI